MDAPAPIMSAQQRPGIRISTLYIAILIFCFFFLAGSSVEVKRFESLITTTTSSTTTFTTESSKLPNSILVLNEYYFSNKPVITDSTGKAEYAGDDFNFDFKNGTQVLGSCSITYRGDFYVFGGDYEDTQISKISGCSLERIGSLDFNLKYGACVLVNEETIYLCFDAFDTKQCHVGAGPYGSFSKITKSQFDHGSTRIAASEGSATS